LRDGIEATSDKEELSPPESEAVEPSESVDARTSFEDIELVDDWRSECAMVYFVVLISSSNGVRNETLFSAGKSGLAEAILRGIIFRAGLLLRIEARLWGCL
jgi:hypothetical protein